MIVKGWWCEGHNGKGEVVRGLGSLSAFILCAFPQ